MGNGLDMEAGQKVLSLYLLEYFGTLPFREVLMTLYPSATIDFLAAFLTSVNEMISASAEK